MCVCVCVYICSTFAFLFSHYAYVNVCECVCVHMQHLRLPLLTLRPFVFYLSNGTHTDTQKYTPSGRGSCGSQCGS